MTERETQPEKLDRKVFAISIICLAFVSMTMVLFPDGSRDGAGGWQRLRPRVEARHKGQAA